ISCISGVGGQDTLAARAQLITSCAQMRDRCCHCRSATEQTRPSHRSVTFTNALIAHTHLHLNQKKLTLLASLLACLPPCLLLFVYFSIIYICTADADDQSKSTVVNRPVLVAAAAVLRLHQQ